jgi:DNA-directed RNA polymerase subunit RPC12/RpoP
MSHPISKPYICMDCIFVFSIHSLSDRRVPCCPNCGDSIQVKKYKPQEKQKKQSWTEEEMNLIDRIVKGELRIYQVAIKLNRTSKSVRRRVERRIEELDSTNELSTN